MFQLQATTLPKVRPSKTRPNLLPAMLRRKGGGMTMVTGKKPTRTSEKSRVPSWDGIELLAPTSDMVANTDQNKAMVYHSRHGEPDQYFMFIGTEMMIRFNHIEKKEYTTNLYNNGQLTAVIRNNIRLIHSTLVI